MTTVDNTQHCREATAEERADAAWSLVLLGSISKPQVCAAAGVSEASVAAMRRVKRQLGSDAFLCRSWGQARRRTQAGGEECRQEEPAADFAYRLRRYFGDRLLDDPDVSARALALHFNRRLPELARALAKLAATGRRKGRR